MNTIRTGNDSGGGGGRGAGELLVRRRRAMGLTQEEVAQRSALSVRTISDIERGHTRRPRPRSLQLLAAALNLNQTEVAHLLELARNTNRGDFYPDVGLDVAAGRVLPRQIPMAPRHFAGRDRELRALSAQLDDDPRSVALTVICGPPGVGKTALAVYWAHQVSDRFPDGQLYVDLGGGQDRSAALSPAEAIARFLEAFNVPAARIPAGLDARAALYRSLLAGKKVLIVLDGAGDAEQVLPLLPGSAGCLVVVTSRNGLIGLVASHGARPISLDVLSPDDAREFLATLLGHHRVVAEEAAVAELIERCERSPLALSTVAAYAIMSPSLPLAALLLPEFEVPTQATRHPARPSLTGPNRILRTTPRCVGGDH
ncbi:MAG TPA: helix-turn-helix domain-containing protein [Streptosporangiaceae bacterium]|nr:helix-turn-helix domain-containing protein [Streptosporangiaceae bacterium]